MYKEDSLEKTWLDGESPAMSKSKVSLKMIENAEENCEDFEIEEPVSPPACDPEEGPPLICYQSIEDLVNEVVDQKRKFDNKHSEEKMNTSEKDIMDIDNIPMTINLEERMKTQISFPSLIPATVSEIVEDLQNSPHKPPATLHMSGGMVSTDMTLHMASVPTSVITSSTFKHSLAHSAVAEDKLEKDRGMDNILQHFKLSNEDDIAKVNTKNNHGKTVMNDKLSSHTAHLNPSSCPPISSYVSPNLPLDLSVFRIPAESTLVGESGAGVSLNGRGRKKRQREELTDEGLDICVPKKSFEVSRNDFDEEYEERFIEMQHNKEERKQENQDLDKPVSNRNEVEQSAMESVNITEKVKVAEEKSPSLITKEVHDITCRLILPVKKEDKARIVFTCGLYVEVDRDVFRTLESKISREVPERQKMRKNPLQAAKNVNSDFKSIRRKKATSRKTSKKQNSIVPAPVGSEQNESERDICDKQPKDMPMIVTNDCLDEREHKTYKPHELTDKKTKTSQLCGIKIKSPTPPPPSPPSSPGLHKLPSIVSKPPYYAKRICKVK